MEHDAGIERDQALRRGEQRVDVDLLDPALFDDELAEADQQLVERGEVDRRAAADALQRGEDLRPLHHPPRERRVERRQRERAILIDLDQLAARPEQQHRSELRVERAADDQLVAVARDHRLHGDAQDMLRARSGRHRGANRVDTRGGPRRAVARLRATPPTSVLCVIVSEWSFRTTG